MTIMTLSTRARLVALATLLAVTACAAPSQPYLDAARVGCSTGDQAACQQVAPLQAQVSAEHNDQAAKVALGILGGLAIVAAGAAAGVAASHPAPVYVTPVVVCRWNCW